MITIESRLNVYLKYEKAIKSTNSLTRHVNTCKILVVLSFHPLPKPKQALEYNNISNPLDVLSDNS